MKKKSLSFIGGVLVGLESLVLSGCSGVLRDASNYASDEAGRFALRSAANVARYVEQDQIARNIGERGLDNVADAVRNQNSQYVNNNYNFNNLSLNPLLWDIKDSDSNGKWIVFSKAFNYNEDDVIKIIRKGGTELRAVCLASEIYAMRNDGSGLRRVTFNTIFDGYPKWVGKNKIMWLSYGGTRTTYKSFINCFDLEKNKIIRVWEGYGEADFNRMENEIGVVGYRNYLHLIGESE